MSVCDSRLAVSLNLQHVQYRTSVAWTEYHEHNQRFYKGRRNNIMLTSANSAEAVNQPSKFIIRDRQFQTEAPWHQRVIEQSEHKARRLDLCRYKQNSFDCHLQSGDVTYGWVRAGTLRLPNSWQLLGRLIYVFC
jgi:hypothetical protein